MVDARELKAGTYELQLGGSFSESSSAPSYHTLRYDFKPKSVTKEGEAYLAVSSNDVQVVVPNADDSMTVFRGSQKPVKADKECLLFFDPNTRQLRLEKIASSITVKKTRDPEAEGVLREEIGRLRMSKKSGESSIDQKRVRSESSGSDSSESSDSRASDSDSSNDGKRASEKMVVSDEDDLDDDRDSSDDERLQREPTHQQAPVHQAPAETLRNDLQMSESSDDDD